MNFIKNFITEEDGVTAIEYGLMAALIAVAIGVAMTSLNDGIKEVFADIGTKLKGAM